MLGFTILMPRSDLYKFEFGIKGLFRADLVIGNHKSRQFVLVEFEGAETDSLFRGGTDQYRYWSPRLERGFGQVIDWTWTNQAQQPEGPRAGGLVRRPHRRRLQHRGLRTVPLAGTLEEQRFDFRRSLQFHGIIIRLYTCADMIDAMEDN